MKNNIEEKKRSDVPAKQGEGTALVTPTAYAPLSPFGLMRRFTEDFERMFDDFNRFRLTPRSVFDFEMPTLSEARDVLWAPQVEVLENNGKFMIRADLPGLKKEDVNVELKENSVVISGERKAEKKEEREGYFRSERSYGSFFRQIPLPKGADVDTANASFKDGVLEISVAMPKKESDSRKLEITEAKAESKSAKA